MNVLGIIFLMLATNSFADYVPIYNSGHFIVPAIKVDKDDVWFVAGRDEGAKYGVFRLNKAKMIWTVFSSSTNIEGMPWRPPIADKKSLLPPDLAKAAQEVALFGPYRDERYDWYGSAEFGEDGGSFGAGIFRFDHKTASWSRISQSNSKLPSDAVFTVARDGNTLWVGTDRGIAEWNLANDKWKYYSVKEVVAISSNSSITLGEPGTPWNHPADYPSLMQISRDQRLPLIGERINYKIKLEAPVTLWTQTDISKYSNMYKDDYLRAEPRTDSPPLCHVDSLFGGQIRHFEATAESGGWFKANIDEAWLKNQDAEAVVSEVSPEWIKTQ